MATPRLAVRGRGYEAGRVYCGEGCAQRATERGVAWGRGVAKGDLTQHAEPFPFQSVFIPRAVPVGGTRARPSEERPRLLRGQDAEPPLQGQAVPRVLVVGGEAGRVRRAGGLPRRGHLLRGGKRLVRRRRALPEPSRSPPSPVPPVP